MIRGFVEAARAFGRADYRQAAERAGEALAKQLVRDGRVFRSALGSRVSGPGMLEDFAAMGLAFVDLYGLTFDTSWLRLSRAIAERTIELFHDPATDTWYDTASDHEPLLVRPREVTDNATPSGTSLVADLLLTWAELDERHEWKSLAESALTRVGDAIAQYPQALGHMAGVAEAFVNGTTQVAIVGNPADERSGALIERIVSVFLPSAVFAGGEPTEEQPALLRDRTAVKGAPTAYVCHGFACELPTADPLEAERQVQRLIADRVRPWSKAGA
jgi:uncharacterized protein YyaL (SSP411 family)